MYVIYSLKFRTSISLSLPLTKGIRILTIKIAVIVNGAKTVTKRYTEDSSKLLTVAKLPVPKNATLKKKIYFWKKREKKKKKRLINVNFLSSSWSKPACVVKENNKYLTKKIDVFKSFACKKGLEF